MPAVETARPSLDIARVDTAALAIVDLARELNRHALLSSGEEEDLTDYEAMAVRVKAALLEGPFVGLTPLPRRVVIRPDTLEESSSGLVIPGTVRSAKQFGRVVALGESDNGYLRGDGEISVGDLVVFAAFEGAEVSVAGEDYLVIDQEALLARVESS